MAKRGKRVVVIERRYIGGSYPNIACLPSKNTIHSAASLQIVSHMADQKTRRAEAGVIEQGEHP